MRLPGKAILSILVLITVCLCNQQIAIAQRSTRARTTTPILWRDPGNISTRDLRFGPGSEKLAPVEPFTFVKEDKSGESPKFEVKDARGVEWRVKLGEEAQSETVSTRLVWSVGYFAEEAYYYDRVRIHALKKLSRGRKHVEDGEFVRGARFEPRRKNVKRGDEWDWDKNPFVGRRELSGLKVIMILLNNFDARKANNRIFLVNNGGGRRQRAPQRALSLDIKQSSSSRSR